MKFNILPPGFDLVIWGHEHDCFTSLLRSINPNCDVYQPGSSVCTSFTEGESLHKHVGIMHIFEDGSFKMKYEPLRSSRLLLYREVEYISFKEEDGLDREKTDQEIFMSLKNFVLHMIDDANKSSVS